MAEAKDFACRGCLKVFRNQNSCDAHERNCPKMRKYESFLKHEKPRFAAVNYGKVALPPSKSPKCNITEPDASNWTPNPDISHSSQPTDSTPSENVDIEQEAANQNQTADTEEVEDPNCPICRVDVAQDAQGIICEMCHTWSQGSVCPRKCPKKHFKLLVTPQNIGFAPLATC